MNQNIRKWINDRWSRLQRLYQTSGVDPKETTFDEFAYSVYRELYEANLLKEFDRK